MSLAGGRLNPSLAKKTLANRHPAIIWSTVLSSELRFGRSIQPCEANEEIYKTTKQTWSHLAQLWARPGPPLVNRYIRPRGGHCGGGAPDSVSLDTSGG